MALVVQRGEAAKRGGVAPELVGVGVATLEYGGVGQQPSFLQKHPQVGSRLRKLIQRQSTGGEVLNKNVQPVAVLQRCV